MNACNNISELVKGFANISLTNELRPRFSRNLRLGENNKIVIYLTSSCVILAFFGTRGPLKLSFHSSFKLVHSSQKKAKITQERVEYNVFLFDEPLKSSKSLKIFKISLTFRFDKLSNL
jgi:hypothetical protein